MNLEALQRPDLIGLSWILTGPLVLVLTAVWISTHFVRRKERFTGSQFASIAFFLVGTLAGYATLWSLFQFLGSFLVLSTDWTLTFLSFFGAFALESLIALYQLERTLTTPKRGRILLVLRGVALGLLLLVLLR